MDTEHTDDMPSGQDLDEAYAYFLREFDAGRWTSDKAEVLLMSAGDRLDELRERIAQHLERAPKKRASRRRAG